MLLVIDAGNTNITIGAYEGDELLFTSRLATDHHATMPPETASPLTLPASSNCTTSTRKASPVPSSLLSFRRFPER